MAATLYVNKSDSRCGECNRSARADEAGHYTIPWWEESKGCGVIFTHVSSDYSDWGGLYDRVREMRPDLIPAFNDGWPALSKPIDP